MATFLLCLAAGWLLRCARYRRLGSSPRTASHRCERTARSTRLSWYGSVIRCSGSWIPACGSSPSANGRSGSAASPERPRCFDSDRCRRHARPALARWRDAGDLAGGSGAGGVGPEDGHRTAVIALAEFHRLGFTHGDAMAENVLVDLEAGVAHWFDFETVHDSSRPMAWRHADDVRALLVTCLVRTSNEKLAETLQFILDVYADQGVTRVLATSFTSVSAPAHVPPRPGGVVLSVFPGDRPVTERAPGRIAQELV